MSRKFFRILAIDGGGAKGVYPLGVLIELERMAGAPLRDVFDLIYGTSTGSIIASALGIGMSAEETLLFYRNHVTSIMKRYMSSSRSKMLHGALAEVFKDQRFDVFGTDIGVVATDFDSRQPVIFKTDRRMAHGLQDTFLPGFGCTIVDAVAASCSAYPFFDPKKVEMPNRGLATLIDGGFAANNPSLIAYTDAVGAFAVGREDIKMISLGTGMFPERFPREAMLQGVRLVAAKRLVSTQFDASANGTERVLQLLTKDSCVIRINDSFSEPSLSTSLFEYDLSRLDRLRAKGRESAGRREADLREFLCD